MKAIIAAAMIATAVALAPRASVTARPAAMQASTTTHGIKLTLILPNRSYAANGLARVTVVEQNISSHPIQLTSECPYGSPRTEVVYGQTVVYPPALDGAPKPHCPLPRLGQLLQPGQSLQRHLIIVLRSGLVRAAGSILVRSKHGTAYRTIAGRPLSLPLTHGPEAYGVVVSSDPPYARFSAMDTGSGPLYYQFWLRCDTGQFTSYPATHTWLESSNADVSPSAPGCPHPTEWHVVAGRLNGVVAVVNYPEAPPPIELGLTLGPPRQPAHLTQRVAISLAIAAYADVTLHPYTVEYGSLDPGNPAFDGTQQGTLDVWKITVNGVSLPSPAPGSGTVYHHLAVVIDDKAGKVLYGRYY